MIIFETFVTIYLEELAPWGGGSPEIGQQPMWCPCYPM